MVHLYDQKITLQTLYHNPTQSLFQKMLLDEVPPADIAEYAVCSDKKLANRGPSASVIEYKLRTSSGDSLESIDQPHASLLKYKTNKGLDLDKMIWLMVLSAKVPEDTREYPIETSILFPIKIEEKSIQEYNWKMHWSLLNIRKTQHLDSDTSHFEKQSWFWWKPYNCCYSWRRNCCGKF